MKQYNKQNTNSLFIDIFLLMAIFISPYLQYIPRYVFKLWIAHCRYTNRLCASDAGCRTVIWHCVTGEKGCCYWFPWRHVLCGGICTDIHDNLWRFVNSIAGWLYGRAGNGSPSSTQDLLTQKKSWPMTYCIWSMTHRFNTYKIACRTKRSTKEKMQQVCSCSRIPFEKPFCHNDCRYRHNWLASRFSL